MVYRVEEARSGEERLLREVRCKVVWFLQSSLPEKQEQARTLWVTAAATSVESQATLPGSVEVEEEEVEVAEGDSEVEEEGVVVVKGVTTVESLDTLPGNAPTSPRSAAVVAAEVVGVVPAIRAERRAI